jgi:hypothetical protein
VGFRGDGNGCFPGATPVAEFWDGTPAQVDRPLMTESFGRTLKLKATTAKVWDVTDEKSKNLVWKTRLPSWGNSQPIVVGDRVFCTGEPDRLICTDARTGAVLWVARANVWELAGVKSAAERVPGVSQATVNLVWAPLWTPERLTPAGRAQLGWDAPRLDA